MTVSAREFRAVFISTQVSTKLQARRWLLTMGLFSRLKLLSLGLSHYTSVSRSLFRCLVFRDSDPKDENGRVFDRRHDADAWPKHW